MGENKQGNMIPTCKKDYFHILRYLPIIDNYCEHHRTVAEVKVVAKVVTVAEVKVVTGVVEVGVVMAVEGRAALITLNPMAAD